MMVERREQQWTEFLNKGLPSKRDERWKYADLTFLISKKFSVNKKNVDLEISQEVKRRKLKQTDTIFLVLINGQFNLALSDAESLPKEAVLCRSKEAHIQYPDLIKRCSLSNEENLYPFAHINSLMEEDGLFLYLPENCSVPAPIHLLSIACGDEAIAQHPQHFVILDKQSQAVLVEEYTFLNNNYLNNMVMNIVVNADARLELVKIQTESSQAVHIATTYIQQKQNSYVSLNHFSCGSLFARDDVIVKLLEPGADCRTAGFYRLQNPNQYIDHHIEIRHLASNSHSEMLYKGTIDKKARAVFNGKLYVERVAQKTLAYQANHHLLLANDAEAYSKPELEIYADDVKCKHGATTGQLDQEALFYLRARGIEHEMAVNILLKGFAEEIFQRIAHPAIKQHVQESLL